eukprot:Lithocolla_globosa_v1_NODE_307_length_4577_cov_13.906457.p1 type:complete len:663 gc:universal NODE_307_length_4577_cov_13.906457:252-2240(+)
MGERITAAIASLSSAKVEEREEAVRFIKNAVIGNKTKKSLLSSHGCVETLVAMLSVEQSPSLQVQLAVTLGSFSRADTETVKKLLSSNVVDSLFGLLKSNEERVLEAVTRTLKLLLNAQVNMSIKRENPSGSVPRLVQLLSPPHLVSVCEFTACIIGHYCNTDQLFQEFVFYGGMPALTTVLLSQHPKAQEAALEALSSFAAVSENTAQEVVNLVLPSSENQKETMLCLLFKYLKNKRSKTRLLAATCLTNLTRKNATSSVSLDIEHQVVPTLIKLMDADNVIREQAPRVLADLITDNENLQKSACNSDAITKLSHFLQSSSDCVTSKLREACFLAVAAICHTREQCRKQVLDAGILQSIVTCLSHQDPNIRQAACSCARSLSRSVKTLRTSLLDAGIVTPLFRLLQDPSLDVQVVACATLCNIVLDFSPMKQHVLDQDVLPILVQLIDSSSHSLPLRLNSVGAISNLLYKSDSQTKLKTMKHLTFPTLLKLLQDDLVIQEQALNIVRNLACGKDPNDIDQVFEGIGEPLLPLLEDKLRENFNHSENDPSSMSASVIIQALYCLVNLATGNEKHKNVLLGNETLLKRVAECLTHTSPRIRIAAVWVVINLSWPEYEDTLLRVEILKKLGIERILTRLAMEDEEQDVKQSVKAALEHFERTTP